MEGSTVSKYTEGQTVTAYVVTEENGPAILKDGASALNLTLVEKEDKGETITYPWTNASGGFTEWTARRAGNGTIKDGNAVWDSETHTAIDALQVQVPA